MSLPEFGRCLKHGYVTERCCVLFELVIARPYLQPAVDQVVRRGQWKNAMHDAIRRAIEGGR